MWNFNHKSQKRPLQLNIFPLHKELIKVMSRRWTKLSSTESEQDLLKRGNAERLLGIHWNCSAPCQQFKDSPNTAQQLNPTSSWRFRCNLHFPPQRVLPPAFSQQLGRIEQGNWKQAVFARAGAAGAFRSGLTTAKSLSPKADEVLEDGFHAEEVILSPSRWIMCVCVCVRMHLLLYFCDTEQEQCSGFCFF